jgi:hypothetical protein
MDKKITTLTITLVLTCTVFFGCDNEKTVDNEIENSNVNTTVVTKDSLDIKEINKNIENFLKQGYITDKEKQNIEPNLKEIDVPEEINDKEVSVEQVIDKENYLITLDTHKNDAESGFYNVKTQEYKQLVINETELRREISTYNENYVIYYEYPYGESIDSSEFADMCIKDLTDNTSRSIFKMEEKDGYVTAHDKLVLVGDKVYFDTKQYIDDVEKMNIYCYDIKNDSLELVKEDAQDPVLVGEDIYAVTKDENDKYRIFSSLYNENAAKYTLPSRCMEIISNSESVFIRWLEEYDENMVQKCVIEDLTKGEVIFTYASIDRIYATDKRLSWNDPGICKPSFYDIENEKMCVIDSIIDSSWYDIQFAKDGTGLLVVWQVDEVKYYSFEY